ncbi:hypothetical protein MMC30_006622 [Trapelia coarctata]|nr:hypothetical protein [Trapelia coarctata]
MATRTPTAGTSNISGSFITRQPGTALWVLLALVSTSIRLPIWLLYFIPKSLRPHPNWTYRQAMLNAIIKQFLYHNASMRIQAPVSLEPGKEKRQFVVMQPAKDDSYQGVIKDAEIKPTAVGGTWYPSLYREGDPAQRIVLHYHGGAYVMGTGRKEDAGYAAKLLVKHVADKAFFPQYRLSSGPGGRFPAALQDAVTSYQYLLDLGIPASSIVVSGDSAGGNLVIAFLRYLADHKGLMLGPAAALLWSPWVNLDKCKEDGYVETIRNFATDYLTSPFVLWGATTFIPDFMSAEDTYISPYNAPFATETPLWIQTCGLEVLRDEDEHFAEVMRGVQGNKVEFHEEPDASHDILLLGNVLGMEDKAENVAKLARKFLDSL